MTHPLRRAAMRAAAALVLAITAPAPALGHAPDPVVGGSLWAQDQRVEYRWRSGQVPPTWLTWEVNSAAADSNASRASRAAIFAFDSAGRGSISYDEPSGCGSAGIACFNRSAAPSSFTMSFRRQGYVFDWGSLRWCQYYSSWPDGCYDVENVALDEFGHVQILGHHDNRDDDSDYLDAVVQTYSRTKPRTGWAVHTYGACDRATLQRRYDVPSSWTDISSCLVIDTTLAISANDGSVPYRGTVTFSVTMRAAVSSLYGLLSGNQLSGRPVSIQRRPPGSTTWYTVAAMSPASTAATYTYSTSLTATADWRAIFWNSPGEGLDGTVSRPITVTVGNCTSSCPNADGR